MKSRNTPNYPTRTEGFRLARYWLCGLAALLLATAPVSAKTWFVTVGGGSTSFGPDDITISAGDTVKWDWDSAFVHSVTSGANGTGDGLFDTGSHTSPFSFSYTFQNPGTYQYFCRPHYAMGMIGFVRVTAAPPTSTRLANISTRLPVQTGDDALIGGFIITGTQPKKVIIRAIGPSLSLPGKLADPVLQLFSGTTLLESNDNWVDSTNKQAIIDSTIPPSNNLEAAIVRSLPANGAGYTAVVRGLNDTVGIGVVEAYDLDGSVDSKLANIATRGLVQADPNTLIAGTIVVGQNPQKVIIRAIGPSLSIAGKLADPTLELRDASGTIMQANDDWKDSTNKQAIIDSGVPPSNDRESAVVATLPGNGANYTAIVRGANGSSGIAVVEVYALP